MSHPAVREAAVIGVPDEYRGETIKAFISLTDNAKTVGEGEQQLIEDILSYCKEHLATFKLPRAIEVLEEIPKSAVGKVLRRQLRERQ
jgi:long-chain acyl-CoA synthetase